MSTGTGIPFGGFGAPPVANANPFAAPPQPQAQQGFAPAPPQQGFAPQGFAPAPLGPGMAGAGPGPSMMAPAGGGFVLNIAPDPTWEPMDAADVLEKDGYYSARIMSEKMRKEGDGVFFSLSLLDEDVVGKTLSKLMLDPNRQKSDIWFTWRNMIRSITGTLEAARQGLQYTVGMFTGHIVYFKTAPYAAAKSGDQRTGVDSWVTKAEWEEAVKSGRHRWVSKPVAAGGGLGALPTGMGGFPAAPGGPGGMPAFPGAPAQAAPAFPGSTPQPGPAPMQAAPAPAAPAPIATPQQVYAPPAQPAPVAAPAFAPPAPSFAFAPPQNGAATPQPPATAAGIAGSFPGAR